MWGQPPSAVQPGTARPAYSREHRDSRQMPALRKRKCTRGGRDFKRLRKLPARARPCEARPFPGPRKGLRKLWTSAPMVDSSCWTALSAPETVPTKRPPESRSRLNGKTFLNAWPLTWKWPLSLPEPPFSSHRSESFLHHEAADEVSAAPTLPGALPARRSRARADLDSCR